MKLLSILLISTCIVAMAYAWCEPGQFQCEKGHWGCQQDDCLCLPGWRTTFPVSQNCEPICGDNQVVGNEECDGGIGCCGCKCREGFQPYNPPQKNCQQITPPNNECPQAPQQQPHAPPQQQPHAPQQQPHAPPQQQPHAQPHSQPHSQPHAQPHAQPHSQPHAQPHSQPHAPQQQPHAQPQGQCQYVTITQGGWGAECHGNNPGCYLDAHFDDQNCFNNVVYLGLNTNGCHYLKFTSAQAIQDFLPAGGRNQALTSNVVNTTDHHIAGVIAGQLLAAKLNTRFDYCDNQFSNCNGNSQDLCFLNSSPCHGYTVKRVIEVADYLIGNCENKCKQDLNNSPLCDFSLNTISDCLASFNEAFDEGHNNNQNVVGQCTNIAAQSSSETSDAASVLRGAAVCGLTLALFVAL